MNIRYVRISTPNQKVERQIVNQYPNEIIYIDVCSGAIPFGKREQGKMILEAIELGKVKYMSVHTVDRLGRNLLDIIRTLDYLDDMKITVKIDSLGIESRVNGKSNPAFKMVTTVMGQVSEMEYNTMLERQKEGIAIAKAKGVYKGRVRGSKISDEQTLLQYKDVKKELKMGMSLRKTAKLCDVSLGTVQKVKKILKKSITEG